MFALSSPIVGTMLWGSLSVLILDCALMGRVTSSISKDTPILAVIETAIIVIVQLSLSLTLNNKFENAISAEEIDLMEKDAKRNNLIVFSILIIAVVINLIIRRG